MNFISSDLGENHTHSEVVECQSSLHPQRISQQEPCRPPGMQQGIRIHGDHDASIFQNYRMGRGKFTTWSKILMPCLLTGPKMF